MYFVYFYFGVFHKSYVFTISLTYSYSFLLILTEKCKESCQDKFVNNNPALPSSAPSTLSTDQHRDFETRVYMKKYSFFE